MAIRKSPTRSALAWWLSGDEECPHCHQLYAYEIEIRCPVCDGPSCPHCICIVCRDEPEAIEETSRGG